MLNELIVLDLSTVLAGPSVGTFFSELGAHVIKIEHPTNKDVTRSWKLPVEDSSSDISAYFSSINYKKEYLSLDLSRKEDHAQFLEMVKKADVVISNFKRKDYQKFGIEDKTLLDFNPSLIIGKINGYGSESDRVAYDLILQAESGFMSINGTEGSGPVKMPVALIDVLAAHHLKEAILIALLERERSGMGRSLSVSLYDAAVSSLVNQASNYLMTGFVPQRIGSKHPNIAPYGELFNTSDGATLTFAIGSDSHFSKLCKVIGEEQLSIDPRFKTNQLRVKNREELYDLLNQRIHILNSNELLEQLHSLNVPAGKVKNIEEVFNDPAAQSLVRKENISGIDTKRVSSVIFK